AAKATPETMRQSRNAAQEAKNCRAITPPNIDYLRLLAPALFPPLQGEGWIAEGDRGGVAAVVRYAPAPRGPHTASPLGPVRRRPLPCRGGEGLCHTCGQAPRMPG